MLEKLFHLKENHTDVKTELMAGSTSFLTMAYILAVNPGILAAAGMDQGAVFTATAMAAFIGTLCMAFFANYPFALAPGMGLNAYFAYTVVLGMGYSWRVALAAVFAEGLLFLVLSIFPVREAIFHAIPLNLKKAVSAGIGLFITFIGLDSFQGSGITVLLAAVGVLVTGLLVLRKVKGNILWGILITWGLGILCQLAGFYMPSEELGLSSLLPDFSGGLSIPSLAPVFGRLSLEGISLPEFITIVFAFLFVDIFDTLGTLIGASSKAGMLDEEGRLPHIKGALLADAVGTTAGAVLGTSTVTTFVESASGVSEGGRTGLTSLTTGILFLFSLFLSPVFLAIPSFATAPALIIVGFYMMSAVTEIDFSDASEGLPAFLCIIAMPFFNSISEGIAMGVISYVVLNLLSGRGKKAGFLMIGLAVLFLLKYATAG